MLAFKEAFELASELAERTLFIACLTLPVVLLAIRVDHILERSELVVLRQGCPELRLELLLNCLLASIFVGAELGQDSRACALRSLELRQCAEHA